MSARFFVKVLPREPQGHIENSRSAGILIRPVAAARLLLVPLPNRGTSGVGYQSGRVEVIDLYMKLF